MEAMREAVLTAPSDHASPVPKASMKLPHKKHLSLKSMATLLSEICFCIAGN